MKYGVVGAYGSVAEQITLAQVAEETGWDGYFTWDGISIGAMDTWDPFTLLGAIAATTQRVTLGALVIAAPRHHPWELARKTLTVDHLSQGRLVLPVGLGAVEDRGFSGVGGLGSVPHGLRDRADLLDETLAILDAASSGEPFSYNGVHHQLSDVTIAPRPLASPRVPIWPVGSWPSTRSMARAATWDGIVLQLRGERGFESPTPEDAREAVAWLTEHRGEAGMSGLEGVVQGALAGDVDAADRAAALEEAGATWWIDSRWDPQVDTAEAVLALVRQGPPGSATA